MSQIINNMKAKILKSGFIPKIVYPEGWNKQIQIAADILQKEGKIDPILLFRTTNEVPNDIKVKFYVIEEMDLAKYSQKLFELRQAKGMTLDEAKKLVQQPNFLAALMVKMNEADGEICGIEYTTKDTLKPALQIVKTAPGAKLVSSVFIIAKEQDIMIFSDCAININPTSEELANMALMAGKFSKDILEVKKPAIALLSYSTLGSGAGESVDKVKKTMELIGNDSLSSEFDICGEIQFDAAFDNNVRAKKAPNCKWFKHPDVFMFPNIDAGNIGYKIAQRMGGYNAFGPALIGLAAPINDLSRGANSDDVIGLTYLTAVQVIAQKK